MNVCMHVFELWFMLNATQLELDANDVGEGILAAINATLHKSETMRREMAAGDAASKLRKRGNQRICTLADGETEVLLTVEEFRTIHDFVSKKDVKAAVLFYGSRVQQWLRGDSRQLRLALQRALCLHRDETESVDAIAAAAQSLHRGSPPPPASPLASMMGNQSPPSPLQLRGAPSPKSRTGTGGVSSVVLGRAVVGATGSGAFTTYVPPVLRELQVALTEAEHHLQVVRTTLEALSQGQPIDPVCAVHRTSGKLCIGVCLQRGCGRTMVCAKCLNELHVGHEFRHIDLIQDNAQEDLRSDQDVALTALKRLDIEDLRFQLEQGLTSCLAAIDASVDQHRKHLMQKFESIFSELLIKARVLALPLALLKRAEAAFSSSQTILEAIDEEPLAIPAPQTLCLQRHAMTMAMSRANELIQQVAIAPPESLLRFDSMAPAAVQLGRLKTILS
jgi:hypothetical protein